MLEAAETVQAVLTFEHLLARVLTDSLRKDAFKVFSENAKLASSVNYLRDRICVDGLPLPGQAVRMVSAKSRFTSEAILLGSVITITLKFYSKL